jgi:hypothetical protein
LELFPTGIPTHEFQSVSSAKSADDPDCGIWVQISPRADAQGFRLRNLRSGVSFQPHGVILWLQVRCADSVAALKPATFNQQLATAAVAQSDNSNPSGCYPDHAGAIPA